MLLEQAVLLPSLQFIRRAIETWSWMVVCVEMCWVFCTQHISWGLEMSFFSLKYPCELRKCPFSCGACGRLSLLVSWSHVSHNMQGLVTSSDYVWLPTGPTVSPSLLCLERLSPSQVCPKLATDLKRKQRVSRPFRHLSTIQTETSHLTD